MHRLLSVTALSTFIAAGNLFAAGPFVENFPLNNARWSQSDRSPATWVTTGGPAGPADAFISTAFTLPTSGTFPVAVRASARNQAGANPLPASGGAFMGSYADIDVITVFVRHDYASPLPIGLRLGSGAGVGMAIAGGQYVQPNTWTQLSFLIDAANPHIISFEGTPGATRDAKFARATLNVADFQFFVDYTDYEADNSALNVLIPNTQVAYGVPANAKFVPPVTEIPINIAADRVSIPEPSALGLAALAFPALTRRRRA